MRTMISKLGYPIIQHFIKSFRFCDGLIFELTIGGSATNRLIVWNPQRYGCAGTFCEDPGCKLGQMMQKLTTSHYRSLFFLFS